MAFPSLDALVDTLLANEGRTWTLHGQFCDERCTRGRHGHAHRAGHGDQGHGHHDHGRHGGGDR